MDFKLAAERLHGYPIVRVLGGVDLATAPMLDDHLQQLIASGERTLAIDLSECPYFDSDGIKALIKAVRSMDGNGSVVVCGAKGIVNKVFEISGLDRIFQMLKSVDDLEFVSQN